MYNRYVPTSDGNYVRRRVADTDPPFETPAGFTVEETCPPEPEPPHECPHEKKQRKSSFGFLKNLLPKNCDTGDLLVLIVVLLLLLDNDDNEDLLPVLITAAAFLFLQ